MYWAPSIDHYGQVLPVFSVVAAGDVLGWFAAYSSQPNVDRVRNIEPTKNGGFRVDLDTYPNDLSVFFRRPTSKDGYKEGLDWVKTQRLTRDYINWLTQQRTDALRQAIPEGRRDGLYAVSYWGAYDFRWDQWVPAGIVVPHYSSALWIPLPGWEEQAEEHNAATQNDPRGDPMALLTDLAERSSGDRTESLTYPEYVRAANEEDAARIAMARQRISLIKILGTTVGAEELS